MIRAFTTEYILSKARPASYLQEIRACAKVWDEHGVQVDTNSPCWIALHAKYAGYRPSLRDRARAAKTQIKRAATVVEATTTAVRVSSERREQREGVCLICDQCIKREGEPPRCGVCGCGTTKASIVQVTAFEENLPYWGCKHPDGSRFKKAGL